MPWADMVHSNFKCDIVKTISEQNATNTERHRLMAQIVLATRNKGKIRELAEPMQHAGLQVLGLEDFPNMPEIQETGRTFAENALLKARTVAASTGLVAVADDSGLMVDALAGAPGVFSARYADDLALLPGESRDARNIRKLLAALAGIPPEQRTAAFVTVMAACKPDITLPPLLTRGEWHGQILEAPRGKNGFGYDPVFLDPESGHSAAELSRTEKMARSHRSQALQKLLRAWSAFWQS